MKEYVISIKIVEVNKLKALEELDRIVNEIKVDVIAEGESDMSMHDDTYLPYHFWSCFEREHSEGA